MQELTWIEHIGGNLEEGVEFINSLHWNLTVSEDNNIWFVRSGEKLILKTDSRQSIEAFLYGMSLAYTAASDDTLEQIREENAP